MRADRAGLKDLNMSTRLPHLQVAGGKDAARIAAVIGDRERKLAVRRSGTDELEGFAPGKERPALQRTAIDWTDAEVVA